MIAMKRVVVATDFGEAAEVALNYGREFARAFGARLDVLHVCANAIPSGLDAEPRNFFGSGASYSRKLSAHLKPID